MGSSRRRSRPSPAIMPGCGREPCNEPPQHRAPDALSSAPCSQWRTCRHATPDCRPVGAPAGPRGDRPRVVRSRPRSRYAGHADRVRAAVGGRHSERRVRRDGPARHRDLHRHTQRGEALCRRRPQLLELPSRPRPPPGRGADVGGLGALSALPVQERRRQHHGDAHPGLLPLQHERHAAARRQRDHDRAADLFLLARARRADRRQARRRRLSRCCRSRRRRRAASAAPPCSPANARPATAATAKAGACPAASAISSRRCGGRTPTTGAPA